MKEAQALIDICSRFLLRYRIEFSRPARIAARIAFVAFGPHAHH
ncbi:MAG: hypothetical protein ABIV63_03225 [Caldimonas sp.]